MFGGFIALPYKGYSNLGKHLSTLAIDVANFKRLVYILTNC